MFYRVYIPNLRTMSEEDITLFADSLGTHLGVYSNNIQLTSEVWGSDNDSINFHYEIKEHKNIEIYNTPYYLLDTYHLKSYMTYLKLFNMSLDSYAKEYLTLH